MRLSSNQLALHSACLGSCLIARLKSLAIQEIQKKQLSRIRISMNGELWRSLFPIGKRGMMSSQAMLVY